MLSPAAYLIVLDTLGKLHAHGHGLNGYCRGCGRRFGVPMPFPMAARGFDTPVVGMQPLSMALFPWSELLKKWSQLPKKLAPLSPAVRLFRATTSLADMLERASARGPRSR
jgi:hypothetical protein